MIKIIPLILIIILIGNRRDTLNKSIQDSNNTRSNLIDTNQTNESVEIITINELNNYEYNLYNSNNTINDIYIPYFELLNDISIPKDFDNTYKSRAISIPKDSEDKDYGKVDHYEFSFNNSKSNRSIIISLSDKNKPYRKYSITSKDIKKSLMNGISIEIYNYQNIYLSFFQYKGYYFDIESNNIEKNEYLDLLYSIIK